MDLLKEMIDGYEEDMVPIMEAISKAIKELKMMKKGGLVTDKMVKDFMKSNKSLVSASALNALAAYKQYKTNTRNTISFFAVTPYEKRMVTKLVKDLIDSKTFKLHRTKYASGKGGGKYWELKKIKAGF